MFIVVETNQPTKLNIRKKKYCKRMSVITSHLFETNQIEKKVHKVARSEGTKYTQRQTREHRNNEK